MSRGRADEVWSPKAQSWSPAPGGPVYSPGDEQAAARYRHWQVRQAAAAARERRWRVRAVAFGVTAAVLLVAGLGAAGWWLVHVLAGGATPVALIRAVVMLAFGGGGVTVRLGGRRRG